MSERVRWVLPVAFWASLRDGWGMKWAMAADDEGRNLYGFDKGPMNDHAAWSYRYQGLTFPGQALPYILTGLF
jgi:hypothetical protein